MRQPLLSALQTFPHTVGNHPRQREPRVSTNFLAILTNFVTLNFYNQIKSQLYLLPSSVEEGGIFARK